MPLSDYSDQQLLEELLQRATKRDGLGLEGYENGNLTQVSYREVVPVEGMLVPDGCMWANVDRPDPFFWNVETGETFRDRDVYLHLEGTVVWRAPVEK